MLSNDFKELFKKVENSPGYALECLKFRFTEEVSRVLNDMGLTRKEFSDRIGWTASKTTRFFRGSSSLTLQDMADIAKALDKEISIVLVP